MIRVDYADVQGLVRFGYGHMTSASYVLVRIKNANAAKAWLRSAPITTAVEQKPPPNTALNIAFTAPGLKALGIPESIIGGFSHEFRGGIGEESRSRHLGDVGKNAPSNWAWGSGGREPHAVIMFFAEQGQLDPSIQTTRTQNWSEAFAEITSLGTSNLDGDEPFGFADGISQPQIDWEQQLERPCTQSEYTNVVALGEFLLGYPNEYGKITDRPLLEPDDATKNLLNAEDAPAQKDLARNGSYLVIRQLEQDVRGFWKFVYEQAGGNVADANQLGAKMVGRTRAGDPLVPVQAEPIAGTDPRTVTQNQFTYESDPVGARCPFGAHVRRTNPRNSDFPERRPNVLRKLMIMLGFGPKGFYEDLTSSVRFHRILRRGREYGSELLPEEALQPPRPNESARGLHFICLNANISRQFEFLQNAWITNTKFSGTTAESDPLLGNRESIPGCPATGNFTIPGDGTLRRRVSGLPQFVTVRGGGYFFLPSLRALRYFAGV
ncbi:MAG: Dyp-type peroxidase [Candidatus Udaeobacter sp.]